MSEDVVGEVARGIYSEVLRVSSSPAGAAPFFDELPTEAKSFMRAQARRGLERLRGNVTDGMVAAAAGLGFSGEDAEAVFDAMLGAALATGVN